MSNEMLQRTIDLVSSLEVKNETQQIAKYELIEYTERLHKENQELKKQLEEKNNGFVASTEELVEYAEENERLKEQLEVGEEQYQDLVEEKEKIKESYDSLVLKHESQQKEFIEWLENEINKCEYGEKKYADSDDMSYHNENELRKEILAKYKEIIRGRNGN